MGKNRVCELLGIQYPVIQAPMNWITDSELAASVSNAGGLGIIGPNAGCTEVTSSVTETGERLRAEIRKAKLLSTKPFGVNLIAPEASIVFPEGADESKKYSDECLRVILAEGVPVVLLTGKVFEEYVRRLKDAGITILYRAMPINVQAATEGERAGVDAIVAVSFEGGGHSGRDRLPTSTLIPQIVDAVKIPVVAGGGIVDGRGMAAALALGAEGVFMGTRFIASTECKAHWAVKQAIVDACDTGTLTVEGIPGVLRALKTPLIERCLGMETGGCSLREISETYDGGYRTGMLEGNTEATIVCGAGAGLIKEVIGAAAIVTDIISEAQQVVAGLRETSLFQSKAVLTLA
jgi:enoyl-[acyl-carrier protein] reductase II